MPTDDSNKTENEKRLATMRHSVSHIMAEAVKSLFPEARFGIGPAIENGFYYDFDLPRAITTEDLPQIEEKMRELIKKPLEFKRENISKTDARLLFSDQKYKLELIEELEDGDITIYRSGNFVDLCAGPHVLRLKK
jgi:threonyl-tRNA synthetase